MTIKELKKKLEILELNNLGGIEIYFEDGVGVTSIETVFIDNHLPVIILEGIPMENEMRCGNEPSKTCDEKCTGYHKCGFEGSSCVNEIFPNLLNINGRDEIDESWKRG